MSLRALVEQVLSSLGQDPAQAQFQEEPGADGVTLTVRLPYSAMQVLDGRDHRRARAIRQVLSAAAAAQNTHFELVVQAQD